MSDWHFGMDYDMWLYPPVNFMDPDYNYELPEPIEAANIEGTLLVNADDAIEQVRRLMAENAMLREQVDTAKHNSVRNAREYARLCHENDKLRELAHLIAEYVSADQCEGCVAKRACSAGKLDMCWIRKVILEKLHELGMEVDA